MRLEWARRTPHATLGRWLGMLGLLALGCGAPAPGGPATPAAALAPSAVPAAAAPAAATARPAPVTLRAAELGVIADATMYLAVERGYFAEQGIEMDLQRTDPQPVFGLIATGQVDMGTVSVSTQ